VFFECVIICYGCVSVTKVTFQTCTSKQFKYYSCCFINYVLYSKNY